MAESGDLADKLAQLETAVLSASKYRSISPAFVRRIGERELAKDQRLKQAIKATKNKLHQVGGAYFETQLDYAQMLAQLRQMADSTTDFRSTCRNFMRRHISTRERLPILEEFYETTLSDLVDIRVVIDMACGLNPLARSWMPINENAQYIAYDIYANMIEFLDGYLALAGVNGRAEVRDIIGQPPVETADLVLLLKTLPVLEQVEKGAAKRLLNRLHTRYMLISFPAHSLGGRSKGMAQNYEAQFRSWIEGKKWRLQRFEFPTELAFLVHCERMD